MSSFDYERHIDEMMELEALRAEYDAWRMEFQKSSARRSWVALVKRQEPDKLSPLMRELLDALSV